MVDSVNVLIVAVRRGMIEDIFEQLEIFLVTVHKILYNFAFSKVRCHWISIIQGKIITYSSHFRSKNFCMAQIFLITIKSRAP